jgi:high affinity Mn2+ porin
MTHFGTRTIHGALVIALMLNVRSQALLAQGAPSTSSPDPALAKAPATVGSRWAGFYLGGYAGVSSGGSAWSMTQPGAPSLSGRFNIFRPFNVFNGSGSQFGGLGTGYAHVLPSRALIGLETDVAFGAEPVMTSSPFRDTTQLFGTARGRIGYQASHGVYYATAGLAWTYDQLTRTDGIVGGSPGDTGEAAFAKRVGWTVGGGVEAPVAP